MKSNRITVTLAILALHVTLGEPGFGSRQPRAAFVPQTARTTGERAKKNQRHSSVVETLDRSEHDIGGIRTSAWNRENLESCSQLWNLSPEQTIQLRDIGEKLAKIQHPKNNPFEVVRFLEEYKQKSQQEVEDRFRAMIEWRQKNQVDRVLDEYHPPSLYRYFPGGVLQGVDKDGDPIHVERTGAADTSGLLKRYGREEMVKQAIWMREVQSHGYWQQDYEQDQGHPVKQFTVVLDMKDLKARNLAPSLLSVGQEVSRIVQDEYPGFAKRIIIIRAPAIFQLAYNALKPFIEDEFKEKIIIPSATNYKKALEQYMDLTVLPPEICPEGHGKAVDEFDTVWKGGPIPDREEPPRTQKHLHHTVPTNDNLQEDRVTNMINYNVAENLHPHQHDTHDNRFRILTKQARNWVRRQPKRFIEAFATSFSGDYSDYEHPTYGML